MSCLACRCCHAALWDCQLGFVIPTLRSGAAALGAPAMPALSAEAAAAAAAAALGPKLALLASSFDKPLRLPFSRHKSTSHHNVKGYL